MESVKRAEKAKRIGQILDELYPDPPIPLNHRDPFTLLVAVMLSAQTTDKKVNEVTPQLFKRAKTPKQMAQLEVDEIREIIREIGLAPTKAKNLKKTAQMLQDQGGQVPSALYELEALPWCWPQDRAGCPGSGICHPRVSGRHPHSSSRHSLGADQRQERQADRTGSEEAVPGRHVERAPPSDHLLRS